jgi:hypothetical protein
LEGRRDVGRVARIASYGEQSRLPVRRRNSRLHRRANRTIADNLAQRANGTVYRSRVQITAPAMGNLAQPGDFVMMMKGLSGEEMKLAGEQHAHHEDMRPESEPEFSPASHLSNFALPKDSTKLPAELHPM